MFVEPPASHDGDPVQIEFVLQVEERLNGALEDARVGDVEVRVAGVAQDAPGVAGLLHPELRQVRVVPPRELRRTRGGSFKRGHRML